MLKVLREHGWFLGVACVLGLSLAGPTGCTNHRSSATNDTRAPDVPEDAADDAADDAAHGQTNSQTNHRLHDTEDTGMTTAPPTTPSSTMERLAEWGGADLGVNPWHLVKVEGLEFFYLANTVQYRGVAVTEGSAEPLTGDNGFRAARDRGVKDPWQLAALALHFFHMGGSPLKGADEAKGQPAAVLSKVGAPSVQGNTLTFWGWDKRGDSLIRFQLDLTTMGLSSRAGAELAAAEQDVIELAKQRLAGPSDTLYAGAIDMLVAACQDPRAADALNDVIREHKNAGARSWAAFQAPSCKNKKTVATLIHALEKDAAAEVRKHAADSLGKLGAKEARSALEQAQKDADISVRGAAGRALGKLK